jgi:hypothetical protein
MGLIKSLSIGIGANASRLTKDLKGASNQIGGWASKIGKIGIAAAAGIGVAGVAAGGAAISAANAFGQSGDELTKASDKTGASVESLSELRHAASQSAVEFGALTGAMNRQQKGLTEAASGNDAARAKFEALGLSVEGLMGLSPDQQFESIAQAISVIEDPAKRTTAAMSVFGKSGSNLMPLMLGGAEGIATLRKEARDLGLQVSTKDAAAATLFGDTWANLKSVFSGLVFQFGSVVAPVLTNVMQFLIQKAVELRPVFSQTFNLIGAYFGMLWDIASSVIGSIGSLFGGFGSVTMKGFVEGVVGGLATLEYGYLNWRKVAELAIKTIAFKTVQFGNELIHLFSEKLPTVFVWWANNGFDIMMRLAANALTLFENLGSNIVAIFSNLPDLIAGKVSFDDLLIDLNHGMIDVVENALVLPERVEGELEKSLRENLQSLQTELSSGLRSHVSKRLEELIPATETPKIVTPNAISKAISPIRPTAEAAATIGANSTELAKEVGNQFASLAERGSQEYRESILRFQGLGKTDNLPKEQRDLAKQQLEELKKFNKKNEAGKIEIFSIA